MNNNELNMLVYNADNPSSGDNKLKHLGKIQGTQGQNQIIDHKKSHSFGQPRMSSKNSAQQMANNNEEVT